MNLDNRNEKWAGLTWNNPVTLSIDGVGILKGRIDETDSGISKKDARVLEIRLRIKDRQGSIRELAKLTAMRPARSQSRFPLGRMVGQALSVWPGFQPQNLLTGIPLPLTTYNTLMREVWCQASWSIGLPLSRP
jgi:hypothetical protein